MELLSKLAAVVVPAERMISWLSHVGKSPRVSSEAVPILPAGRAHENGLVMAGPLRNRLGC